ncbi:MAG: electron transport complex subunit RsxC [Tissierellales bacterium]|jgi:electron transport complex protein RnfC|nr:electron transport complex subunit RsxC [Tissierellales bacterium]
MKLEGLTFKGGIHPPHFKSLTEAKTVEKANEPKMVVIPLHMHIGAPCEPVVKVMDEVKVGQMIGEAKSFVAANIHSSVSGKVKKVADVKTPLGKAKAVFIESDGKNELHESVKPKGSVESLSAEELLAVVKEAGITGMGGASFPTHVKLSPPKDKPIDVVILNGAECEPYLTADHRLMLETPERVVEGLRIIMKILGVKEGFIAIETNKPDAIEAIKKASEKYSNVHVASLIPKYPQGDEKRIINAVTGREVPSGGLPMDAGAVVDNVGTAAAIADAVTKGMPLIERIVTITGSAVKEPKNLLVKVGTSFSEVIEQCGGAKENIGKIIMGGPMMGLSQYTDDIPVIKGTSGILMLDESESKVPQAEACIRCGKCVDACPVHLQPLFLSQYAMKNLIDEAESMHVADCIECGSCSYICPARRPLVETIRLAKREVIARRRNR